FAGDGHAMQGLAGGIQDLYFGGQMEAGLAMCGQVAGRIESIRPVAEIVADTVREYAETISRLHAALRA
ncbi:MAG: hypothetical protein R3F35_12440, partial [Myxococcota bacterium]